ncbi:MAG TPA: hypothetical protein VEG38_05785 [Acidimicrobiia bacterium]|nr:hypothetical protein [Acidimicrobiia bacterium]
MGQRLPVVVGVALALVAAACRSNASDERPVAEPGRIVTVAGTDDFDGSPLGVAFDLGVGPDGTLYAIEGRAASIENEPGYANNLWAIPPSGRLRLVAGVPRSRDTFSELAPTDVVDPSPRLGARSLAMRSLAVGSDGTVFVGDLNNNVVWALGSDGRGRVVAGSGEKGFSGDGGPATAARLDVPDSLAVNQATGDLYIATNDHRIRRVDSTGLITTVVGDGTAGSEGDGGPAVRARLHKAESLAVDPRSGELYFCDVWRIRKIDASRNVVSVAGTGAAPELSAPAGRQALESAVDCTSLAVDPRDGIVYFSDTKANQIRRIAPSGIVEVVAGTGATGRTPNDEAAATVPIAPSHLAIDGNGNIYFVGHLGETAIIQMIGAG